jgi:hypothetical protein
MSRVAVSLEFEHNYVAREVEYCDPPAAAGPIYEFKDASVPPLSTSWLTLLISPANGPEWIGRFAIAYDVPPAINGVYSTPSPDWVCVVGGGQGFVIDVRNPSNFEQVRCFPINSVAQSPTTSRLVFADFTDLEAWDANGKAWESGTVATDELTIVRINGGNLVCRGWYPEYTFEFDVDLIDGTVVGERRQLPD